MASIIEFFLGLWKVIDGKKTEIGGIILIVSQLLSSVATSFGVGGLDGIVGFLNQIGAWIGGIGLAHGVVKTTQKPK